jgi:hypothetical protein
VLADHDLAERAQGESLEEGDSGGPPHRDEHGAALGRDQRPVGLGRQRRPGDDASRGHVHGRDRLAEDVGGVERPPVGGEGVAGDEARVLERASLLVLLRRGEHERAAGREPAAPPLDLPDRVVRGSRGEEPLPVGVPHETEPGVVEGELLDHLPALEVHEAQARLRPAVVRDREVAPVRVESHRQGEVARVEVAADGGNAPAVGQQSHPLPEGARAIGTVG